MHHGPNEENDGAYMKLFFFEITGLMSQMGTQIGIVNSCFRSLVVASDLVLCKTITFILPLPDDTII